MIKPKLNTRIPAFSLAALLLLLPLNAWACPPCVPILIFMVREAVTEVACNVAEEVVPAKVCCGECGAKEKEKAGRLAQIEQKLARAAGQERGTPDAPPTSTGEAANAPAEKPNAVTVAAAALGAQLVGKLKKNIEEGQHYNGAGNDKLCPSDVGANPDHPISFVCNAVPRVGTLIKRGGKSILKNAIRRRGK